MQNKELVKGIWLPAWFFGTFLEKVFYKQGCTHLAQAWVESSFSPHCDLVLFPQHSSTRELPARTLPGATALDCSSCIEQLLWRFSAEKKIGRQAIEGTETMLLFFLPFLYLSFLPANQWGTHWSLSNERTQCWIWCCVHEAESR